MKSCFPGVFMIFFLVSTGAIAVTAAIQGCSKVPAVSSKQVLQGKWAEDFEDSFNKSLVTYNPSLNGWGALNYLLFKEGNEGVIIGKGDWLFTKEEFDYHHNGIMKVEEKLDFIAAVQQHLKKYNARLVVVPVPAKARIYHSYLQPYHFPDYRSDIYNIFIEGLSSHLAYRHRSGIFQSS